MDTNANAKTKNWMMWADVKCHKNSTILFNEERNLIDSHKISEESSCEILTEFNDNNAQKILNKTVGCFSDKWLSSYLINTSVVRELMIQG